MLPLTYLRMRVYVRSPMILIMQSFLGTYKSFTSARVLLKKLLERFHVPPHIQLPSTTVTRIQLRVAAILKTWLTVYALDFTEPLLQTVDKLTNQYEKVRH
jgi:RasGEF N-terminal motif